MADVWAARINAVIDAVRDNLSDSHSLDRLASRAHAAPHHFHRQFRDVTGETPTQFVRRSRLERAAYLMMAAPAMSLTQVCFEAGFTDQSVFSRSFRQVYGVTPSSWRKHNTQTSEEHRQTRSTPEPATVRIITRPAMRLAMVQVRGIFGLDDLSTDYKSLCAWMDDHDLDRHRSSLIGASFDNYRTTPPERVHYSFGFTVPPDVEASGAVHIRELPAFTAAAVHVNGGLTAIADAWNHLYDTWFPPRPWTPTGLPAMKLFNQPPDRGDWTDFDLDCAIAIRHNQT